MSWIYAVVIDDTLPMADFVREIDEIPSITDWYTCLGHLVFVESPRTASFLSTEIKTKTGIARLFVVDAGHDRAGWLPAQAWAFLERKKASAPGE